VVFPIFGKIIIQLLTAVIITFNEEKNIARCLDAVVSVADEVIVIDSFSTDNTATICEKYPIRFVRQSWRGYGAQKNFGMSLATYDYVLCLDADEVLSAELQQAILHQKEKGFNGAYALKRINYYYGKFIRHGLEYPDKKIRIFNRQIVQWNNNLVHETLMHLPPKAPATLSGDLYHYTFETVESHMKKMNEYTSLAAENMFRRGKKAPVAKIVFSPTFTFIKGYFLRLGFLEGLHGWILAYVNAYTTFIKYVKLWQLHRNRSKTN
jgi:glycosyltransferase involved in cell wall biosynthesis